MNGADETAPAADRSVSAEIAAFAPGIRYDDLSVEAVAATTSLFLGWSGSAPATPALDDSTPR